MSSAVGFKSCPFCGSRDVFVERSDFVSCYVQCNDCHAQGPKEMQHSDNERVPGRKWAMKAWNHREKTKPNAETGD